MPPHAMHIAWATIVDACQVGAAPANTQPAAHMSTAGPYSVLPYSSSGARYHRAHTCRGALEQYFGPACTHYDRQALPHKHRKHLICEVAVRAAENARQAKVCKLHVPCGAQRTQLLLRRPATCGPDH